MNQSTQNKPLCTKLLIQSFILLFTVLSISVNAQVAVRPASEIDGEYIDWIKKVADWQLTQSRWDSSVSWERGALHAGMMAAYEATKDEKYMEASRQWAEKFNWQLAWDSHHADNMACAQTYLELYFLDQQDPFRYTDYKNQNDTLVANPTDFNCDIAGGDETWWWCDALFMAPPGLVRLTRATGDPAYTNLMHRMWEQTQSCLYDTEDHLFFRDINYLWPDHNYEDQKVFWSRGNGWVIAGTARTLQYLPLDDPNRPHYISLLQEMSAKLAQIQLPDGYWHSDLLSPERYDNPETSGTGFFTFGIAWGINNGFLDDATYWPTVAAGWEALKAAVQPDGLLGWVQPVGADPRSTSETTTDVFGVGAYLLAASEIQKYAFSQDSASIEYFQSYWTDAQLKLQWTDGPTNATASQVALGSYGDNFMELTWQNDLPPYRSETQHIFADAKDFTVANSNYLSILVRGNALNSPESLYVILHDANSATATQTMTDTSIVQTPAWMELAFPLDDFTGIDLNAIHSITIGLGTPDASAPTGQGTVRIDNIRLYPQHCIKAQEDFNDDCAVDMADFAILASQWADEYVETIHPIDPGTDDLTAYWAFNDVDNGYAYDSVASEYNAEFRSNAVWDQTAGKTGGAARFDGASNNRSRVEIPASGLSADAGTVSLWVRPEGEQSSPSTRYIFGHTSFGSWGNRIQLYLDDRNTQLDMGLGSTHSLSANNATLPVDDWTHVALTWDGANYQVYVNGLLTSAGSYSSLSGIQSIAQIGNDGYYNPYEGFNGLIDEVRIYDQPLTASNILYLAETDGYTQIPDPRPTDLVVDGIINIDDLAVFVQSWANQTVWP